MRDHKVLIQNMTLSVFSEEQSKEGYGDNWEQTCLHCLKKLNDNDIVVTVGIGDNPPTYHNNCFQYYLGTKTLHLLEDLINQTQDDENYHYPRDFRNFRVHDQVSKGGKL